MNLKNFGSTTISGAINDFFTNEQVQICCYGIVATLIVLIVFDLIGMVIKFKKITTRTFNMISYGTGLVAGIAIITTNLLY